MSDSVDILATATPGTVHRNLAPAVLVSMAVCRGEAELSADGALTARTGQFTGRSPRDKHIVRYPSIEDSIDWKANRALDPARMRGMVERAMAHIKGRELFVQDLHAGADRQHRLKVRVITEQAWHNLFARNMFIRPERDELERFTPDWTVLQLPGFLSDPSVDGTHSSTVIAIDFEQRLVLIGGSAYAGEIKKSIFTVMNYILPERGVMPMHCSANVGADGSPAVFFGLSGTGKTTLSADPMRTLIGDDEHGWGPNGIFNFEGGCYAKVIRLDAGAEPEIFAASSRFGTILENVVLDPRTRAADWNDGSLTENTRSCYPLDFIPNASATGTAGHPRNIIMLTADAFGVLPPIARLSPEQAMYHFLSGYTAKVAGTERGLTEPEATFSACFGAPFMPRHPSAYAELLRQMMTAHDVDCWLVNTGWTGGKYGVGSRMPIKATRALLTAALSGDLAHAEMDRDPVFGLTVPKACQGVDSRLLRPRDSWADTSAYDASARDVAARFAANFAQYEGHVEEGVGAAGIRVAA
ncbi:MAG: phosphoenolpyruvate carboxykinase [Geminicoccaceae bacterium]|nr:phosphoenolpyruvate carboxykinase [Geminicoccaceae bacterium]MCB9945575.1 phosphoenolpyruvate carboxykinase [Geminicoccaceae bacterium]